MRRLIAWVGFGLAVLLVVLWASGGLAALAAWAAGEQRAVQSAMARAIRAIRAGDPGAWAALLAVCFTYGFVHAVGPGHGKVLIGGYGVARRVPVLRLSLLALTASLGQAVVAISVIGVAVLVFGWSREQVEAWNDRTLAPLGHLMVAGLGLWLVWRGLRGFLARRETHHHHSLHDHVHGPDCGHAHLPSIQEVTAVTGWRDSALLISSIAIRPCAGALFVLILTGAMGIFAAGIAGVIAMAIGTASVMVAVAVLAVWSREGAFVAMSDRWLARALPGVELVAGAVIAAVALQMYLAGI